MAANILAAVAIIGSALTTCGHAASVRPEYMTTPELVQSRNYTVETHYVTTTDGYILAHHRIPRGFNSSGNNPQPVIIQHGLVGDSSNWVLNNSTSSSLGYLLADSGYDVWLINCRGNLYSINHTTLNTSEPDFWDFSWHQMAIYDLPKTIDYILNLTGATQVGHIGHSQGTTSLYVLLAQIPEYHAKIALHISLSPIAYHTHTINPLFRLLAPLEKIGLLSIKLARGIGIFQRNRLINEFLVNACADWSPGRPVCEFMYYAMMGYNPPELDRTQLSMIYGHYPSPSSLMQVTHFVQSMNKPAFAQFDFKAIGNLFHYGTLNPPLYNLSNVLLPIYVFYGGRDAFAQMPDVNRLFNELPNIKEKIYIEDWAHYDFLYGIHVYEKVYKRVVEILGTI